MNKNTFEALQDSLTALFIFLLSIYLFSKLMVMEAA